MSKTAAYVENGVVTNLIVMPDDYNNSDPNVIVIPDGSDVTFGWLWDGTTFKMSQDIFDEERSGLEDKANAVIAELEANNDPSAADWQAYLAQLQGIDLTASNPPVWPTRPALS
ncbi:hypothetical protein [Paraburkholderia graminis]